jgi:hypothetical protein
LARDGRTTSKSPDPLAPCKNSVLKIEALSGAADEALRAYLRRMADELAAVVAPGGES